MLIVPYDDDQPKTWFAPVTHGLIVLDTILLVLVAWQRDPAATLHRWAFDPHHFSLANLVASMFLHAGLGHLIGNMLILHVAGRPLEFRLGPWRYLALYLASGLAAEVGEAIASGRPSVGASGAIAGLMAAYLIVLPWGQVKLFYWFGLVWYGTWEVSAFFLGVYFAGEQVLFLALGSPGSTAYGAHLGGFVFGLGAGWVLRRFLAPEKARELERLERPTRVGEWRRRPVPVVRRDDRSFDELERAASRASVERALLRGDGPRLVKAYEQAHLLGTRPVLGAANQLALAFALEAERANELAEVALRDLVQEHAASEEARRARRLLAEPARSP